MSNSLISIPVGNLPEFDELYVISDLHIGGGPGFQIFNSGQELVRLLDHLCTNATKKRVALVINGDFVDFLADKSAKHFDPSGAVEKLESIVRDPSFALVWEALQRFTATKKRHLIVNLGNHDLELALPWVRQRLLEILSGENEAARGRIVLTFDGAGVLCRVGAAKVLCVHGNEVDDWNLADYETLRRVGQDIVQGRPVEDWEPNAGSKMVIEVMNGLKSNYPFIDLLKPEMQAVIPTLLALAPDQRDKLGKITSVARRLIVDKIKRAMGFLSGDEDNSDAPAPARRDLTRPLNGAAVAFNSQAYAQALLDQTEARLERGEDPLSLVSREESGEFLDMTTALKKLVFGAEKSEVLREALEQLQQDRSFDFADEDDTFRNLDELVGDQVDFLIAGHTHLERALARKKKRGWYFNSGTWARLIKLENAVLQNKDSFRQVFKAFEAGTLKALDDFPGLVLRRLTVVAIWEKDGQTHGELRRVSLTETEPILGEVPNTRFTKS